MRKRRDRNPTENPHIRFACMIFRCGVICKAFTLHPLDLVRLDSVKTLQMLKEIKIKNRFL